jgi:hypothetical protein
MGAAKMYCRDCLGEVLSKPKVQSAKPKIRHLCVCDCFFENKHYKAGEVVFADKVLESAHIWPCDDPKESPLSLVRHRMSVYGAQWSIKDDLDDLNRKRREVEEKLRKELGVHFHQYYLAPRNPNWNEDDEEELDAMDILV